MRKRLRWSLILATAAVFALLEATTVFCAVGWKEEDGKWTYEENDGLLVTNTWKKSGNQYYYLDEAGIMASNSFIKDGDGEYYVDADGARVTSTWVTVPNTDAQQGEEFGDVATIRKYIGSNGRAVTGKKKIEGKEYLFDDEGRMLSGWQYYAGGSGEEELYYLGTEDEGFIHTGWQYLEPPDDIESPAGGLNFYDSEEWFYFAPSSGKAYRGTQKYIDGKYYEFDANGVMMDGWQEDDETCDGSVRYYNQGTGDRPQGWAYVTGPDDTAGERNFYYFDKEGVPFNAGSADGGGVGVKRTDLEQQDDPQSGMALMRTDRKNYLFNGDGQMETGLYELTDVPFGSELCTGLYYFEDEDEVTIGEQQKGTRTFKRDGEEYSFRFRNDGRAYVNSIVDDILYGPDGYQIPRKDEDQGTMLYTLPEDTTWEDRRETLPAGTTVIVKNRKLIQRTGIQKVDGESWKVNGYVATPFIRRN